MRDRVIRGGLSVGGPRALVLFALLESACAVATGDPSDSYGPGGKADDGNCTDCAGLCEQTLSPMLAPPAYTLADGKLAVPIDITHIEAQMVFNVASKAAFATVTVDFTMGNESGVPLFDLRQNVQTVV